MCWSLHFEHKKQLFMLQAKLHLLLNQQGLKFDWLEQLPEKLRQQLLQVKEREGHLADTSGDRLGRDGC